MQLSVSPPSKYGIIQRATFLTFGDSTNHTADFPLADMIASANRWVAAIATQIIKASSTVQYQDPNQSTSPIYTTNLVDDQRNYDIPTTALQIWRVQVLDSSGNWVKLKPVDQSEIRVAYEEYRETKGLPVEYDIFNNDVYLLPAPSSSQTTLTNGLRMYFTNETGVFSIPDTYSTADTTEPGFDEDFHDLVCFGIAHDYWIANDDDKKAQYYLAFITAGFENIWERYANKNKGQLDRIVPRRESLE